MDDYRRIYARKTRVASIDFNLAQDFIAVNHRQKTLGLKTKTINIGLYHNDELIAVAQFGPPRTAKMKRDYSHELLRLAFKNNVRVVGGASKLIQYFIECYLPSDFFTYQDTTGEAGRVYENSGMTLVHTSKKKEYLVAPGKTLANAQRGEYYSMGYVVRLGPDKILGSTLGEIYRPDGKRKTNPELFVEDIGWHLETTSGDKLYEWINPNITFYVYKITASDSDKYYYGVSHIKEPSASVATCLKHNYFGSGGGKASKTNKFSNWKAKHIDTLQKEVLATFSRKSYAYAYEKNIIGDSYRTDPLCLNSTAGGKDGGIGFKAGRISFPEKICYIHGLTKHRNEKCVKCENARNITTKNCSIHGDTKHFGDTCARCTSTRALSLSWCETHGETTHSGGACRKCASGKKVTMGKCPEHGEVKFLYNRCAECNPIGEVSVQNCPTHGEGKHIGKTCYKCISEKSKTKKFCKIHNEITSFVGDSCLKCAMANRDTILTCPIHGEVKFRGGKCISCSEVSRIALEECIYHGEQKHRLGKCYKCVGEKSSHTKVHKNNPVTTCRFCAEAKF